MKNVHVLPLSPLALILVSAQLPYYDIPNRRLAEQAVLGCHKHHRDVFHFTRTENLERIGLQEIDFMIQDTETQTWGVQDNNIK